MLEQMIITMLGIIHAAVKNPKHADQLKADLLGVGFRSTSYYPNS